MKIGRRKFIISSLGVVISNILGFRYSTAMAQQAPLLLARQAHDLLLPGVRGIVYEHKGLIEEAQIFVCPRSESVVLKLNGHWKYDSIRVIERKDILSGKYRDLFRLLVKEMVQEIKLDMLRREELGLLSYYKDMGY
jgi:hypothetical protein